MQSIRRVAEAALAAYREMALLVDPRVERYRRARVELAAAVAALLASPLIILLAAVNGLTGWVILVAGLAPVAAAWLPVVDTVASARSLRGLMDAELPFYIVAAASACRTGLEPLQLLEHASSSRVFKGLRELGERFSALSSLLGAGDALRNASTVAGGRTRLFLAGYSSALSTGTVLEYMLRSAGEAVRDEWSNVSRMLERRGEMGVIAALTAAVAPALTVGFTLLMGGAVASYILASLLAAVFAAAVLIPDYPLPFRLVVDARVARLLLALEAAGLLALATPLAYGFYTGGWVPRWLAASTSVVAVLLGVPGFLLAYTAAAGVRGLGRVAEDSMRHVRVHRSLHLYDTGLLESMASKHARLWIVDYVAEVIGFHRGLGEADPDVYAVFTVFLNDSLRALWAYLAASTITAAAVLASPILVKALTVLAPSTGVAWLTGYVDLLATGVAASKLVFGRNISTLIPGLLTLLYVAL